MVDQTPTLHISALGPPKVRLGDNLVTFPTRKTLALLIYLAIEAGLHPREHLAALLWPEANPERSYASLRNTLSHLHASLRQASSEAKTSYLLVTHHALGLNPDANIDFDLEKVAHAYEQARADRASRMLPEGSGSLPLLQAAAACQQGDFLAGFSLDDAPGFDGWATIQREVWHRRLGLILDRLSEIQYARGEVFQRHRDCLALDCPGCAERNCLSPQDASSLCGRRTRPSAGNFCSLPGCVSN